MTHHRPASVTALALSLLLVGCSSSGGASEPADNPGAGDIPDPCSLLSAADIEAVSSIAFQEGVFNEEQSADFQSICDYQPVDGAFPIVQVLVSPGESQISTQRASAESWLGATVDVAVAGANDAYTVAGGSLVGMAAEGYYIQVAFMTSDVAEVTEITVDLAEVVVAAL